MDTKSDEQLLGIKSTIETNNQEDNKKHKKTDEKLTLLTKNHKTNTEKLTLLTENLQVLTALMIDKINISKYSLSQKYTSTPPDPTTVVPTNRRDPPLERGYSTKIGGMWTLKHEISSPKFYEILIKTELKGDTTIDLENFYNHIKMCLNEVTRLREILVIKATIETNKQEADKNHKKTDQKLTLLTENQKETNDKITVLTEKPPSFDRNDDR